MYDWQSCEFKITPKYLKFETRSRGELSRNNEGRRGKKEEGLREIIIYSVLEILIVRCLDLSQDDKRSILH